MEEKKCPKCGEDLRYAGGHDHEDEVLTYSVRCSSCEWVGYEIHRTEFRYYADECDGEIKEVKMEKEAECLDCKKPIPAEIETDIQLCQECMKNYDVDRLWKMHDRKEIDALDFNESFQVRQSFRKFFMPTKIEPKEAL